MKGKFSIRQALEEDIPRIIEVEKAAWPEGGEATPEMFRSRIRTFPEGVWVAEVKDDQTTKIMGVIAFQRCLYDCDNPVASWKEMTNNGFIAKSHVPDGDSIFGVDLSAHPDAPRRTGSRLLHQVGRFSVSNNLKRGILGGRIPNYANYTHMTPEEYLNAVNEKGEPLDPEVRFYRRASLKIGKIIPNYFDDPDSLSYGVQLIWENPFYTPKRWLAPFKRRLGMALFKLYVKMVTR